MHFFEADNNQAQIDTPHGISQSESTLIGLNLTSVCNSLEMNLLNGLAMLGNIITPKQPEIGKKFAMDPI